MINHPLFQRKQNIIYQWWEKSDALQSNLVWGPWTTFFFFWTNTNCISSTENSYYISRHLHFRSYHSNKMQQIHAWLVGFGVSQLQQRWNSKTSSISWISTLRRHAQGQNKTHAQHVTALNKQRFKTQVRSLNGASEHKPRPLAFG